MAVQHVDTLVVSAEVRASSRRLADRLGVVAVVCTQRWQHVADQLDLGPAATQETTAAPGTTAVVVGSPADVSKHARSATHVFGFVMPVAQIAKSAIAPTRIGRFGRRVRTWRDDATLDLWDLGWSPVNVDRLLVPMQDATIEFVIGDARPIPKVQILNG